MSLPGGGYGFWLSAEAIEPREDPSWVFASRALKDRFWAEARRVAEQRWQASRAAGLDRLGKRLTPIGPKTRRARQDDRNRVTGKAPYSPMGRAQADAPPLTPAGAASRTRAYLRSKTVPGQGAYFYWRFDPKTRHYWGEILARHARGFTQFFRYPRPAGFTKVPARDVIGFSEAEVAAVKQHMAAWWAQRRPFNAPPPVPGLNLPMTTRDKIAAIRTAQPPELRRVTVERIPNVITRGPSLRLPFDDPWRTITPARPVPPRLLASWRAKVARLPLTVQAQLAEPRAAKVAGVLRQYGWAFLWRTSLLVLVIEFIRNADWEEVKGLFAEMGWPVPGNRTWAEEYAKGNAKGEAA